VRSARILAWKLPLSQRDAGLCAVIKIGVQPPSPPGGRVVDSGLFRTLLEMEIAKAQRLRYSLSVICLGGGLPSEGSSVADSTATFVARCLRSTDVVTERGRDAIALLLIDADGGTLPAILRRIVEDLQAAPWSAGGSSYPKNAINADELLAQAARMLGEAERTGGGRLLLQP
jgi:hypothetical protein